MPSGATFLKWLYMANIVSPLELTISRPFKRELTAHRQLPVLAYSVRYNDKFHVSDC